MVGGIYYRRKIGFGVFKTVTFWLISFILFMLMIIWMSFRMSMSTEAEFRIIILNKLEHVQLASELGDWEWDIEGFEYFSNLRDAHLRLAKKLPKSAGPSNGVWVLRNSREKENHIRLTDFQYAIPKKVLMGLRYFISGSGHLVINFRDANSGETESVTLGQDERRAKNTQGFCSKIVTPGHDREIDMIEIRAYPAADPGSFIIIDKVVVTVADGDSSRSLMYSFIPNQWCEVQESSEANNLKQTSVQNERKRKNKGINDNGSRKS